MRPRGLRRAEGRGGARGGWRARAWRGRSLQQREGVADAVRRLRGQRGRREQRVDCNNLLKQRRDRAKRVPEDGREVDEGLSPLGELEESRFALRRVDARGVGVLGRLGAPARERGRTCSGFVSSRTSTKILSASSWPETAGPSAGVAPCAAACCCGCCAALMPRVEPTALRGLAPRCCLCVSSPGLGRPGRCPRRHQVGRAREAHDTLLRDTPRRRSGRRAD